MAALAHDGMTMLVVTHEIAFAREASTRTIFIDGGEIAEQGPSGEVLWRPREERTRQFLSRILQPGGERRAGPVPREIDAPGPRRHEARA
jgi:polar amino acid transport system ATP-binding protein